MQGKPIRSNVLSKFNLHQKVAVVTGGAGLLGTEFCRTISQAGAAVVIADINTASAGALCDEIMTFGGEALAVNSDVADVESVRNMIQSTLNTFGRLDILVNSAALDPKIDIPVGSSENQPEKINELEIPFEEYPLSLWNNALQVNLTGAFLCCQAAVRPMLAQGGGVIVNISSIYGLSAPDQRLYQGRGQPDQFKPVYYSVSKAGIMGLTRYLAAYYAGKNIRVNALTPGGIFNGHKDDFVQAYSSRTMIGRMADKTELNEALLYLVSDASAYMTGANLIIDGGWTAW